MELNIENDKLAPRSAQYASDEHVYWTFTEKTAPHLVLPARQLHAAGYGEMGFIEETAYDKDGTLKPEIDKARGENVDYYLGVTHEPGEDTPHYHSTIRKVHIPAGGILEDLPAYVLSKDNLYPEEHEILRSLPSPARSVKEISAFARSPEVGTMQGFEILRHLLQEALGKDEVWFFSMVSSTYDALTANFGPRAMHQAGDFIPIDKVGNKVSLVPVLVNVDTFLQDNYEAAMAEESPQKQRRLLRGLGYFSQGVEDKYVSDDVKQVRDSYVDPFRIRSSR